jgi:hypothetical protein
MLELNFFLVLELSYNYCHGGTIWGLVTEGFMHNSELGNFGTFISMGQALNYGDGLTYIPTRDIASWENLENFLARTSPIAVGDDAEED